jgi:hypothetical protein
LIAFLFCGCNKSQTLSNEEIANIKAKAESKYLQFFRQMDELKFDSAAMHFSKDIYCMGDGELWSYDRMVKTFNGFKKSIRDMKVSLDSLHSRVISQDAVQMTLYYTMFQLDTSNIETYAKGVQTVLVNPELKDGYVSECIEFNDYFPLQYAENVPKEFQTGYTNLNWRHGFEVKQIYPAWLYLIDTNKKKGIPADKTGEDFGKIIASTWNPQDGFDGFSKSIVFISQAMYLKSKVLERDANTIKVEYSKDYLPLLTIFNVNEEDMLSSWNSAMGQVSNRMGADLKTENTGKSFTMTFTRKKI